MKKQAKKQPRPVTAWFALDFSDEKIDSGTGSDSRVDTDDIRCRVTPLRRPSEGEIERLEAQFCAIGFGRHIDTASAQTQKALRLIARHAFKKGARP